MTKNRAQRIGLIITLVLMGTLFYIAKNPSTPKYDVKDTLPAMLYRSDAKPLNILLEKTWHPDDQIMSAFNDKDSKNNSDEQTLKLPLIQIPDNNEPITIAFDYSGKKASDQKQQPSKFDDIVIKTTIGCPTETPCSIAENEAFEVIEPAKFNLGSGFVGLINLSNEKIYEYGGGLKYTQNGLEETHFIYHQIFTVKIPNPTSAQFNLHLSAPQGIHTDYLKVTIVQGDISYSKPALFSNKAAQYGKFAVLWMVCIFIIFTLLHRRFGDTPHDSPKIFASLLIIWGTFLVSLSLFDFFSTHTYATNLPIIQAVLMIIQGVLIVCAGSLIRYRIYFGLAVLISAMIFSWLISLYLSFTINELFIRTGLITFVTAYAFFSSVRSKLD